MFFLFFVLSACFPDHDEINSFHKFDESGWYELSPYPGAPAGTKCYLYAKGIGFQNAFGGPVCISPGKD